MLPTINSLICPCCGSWMVKSLSSELIKHFDRFGLDMDGYLLRNGDQRIFYFKNVKKWNDENKKNLSLALQNYNVEIINAADAINGVNACVVVKFKK